MSIGGQVSNHWTKLAADPAGFRDDAPLAMAIYDALLDSHASLYLLLDADLRVAMVSHCLVDGRRIQSDALMGRPLDAIFGGDIEAIARDLRCRHAGRKSRRVYRLRLRGEDDQAGVIRAIFYPLDVEGREYWFVDAAPLSAEMEFDRLKADFVANVSHELHTPLASIAGALGLIAAGATGEISDDTAQIVQVALNSTHRLIRLIDNLLDVERIAIDRLDFSLERQSLRAIVRSSIEELVPLASSRGISVILEDDGGPDFAYIDRDRLSQVMINLLSNAIKFSPEEGRVRVVLTTGHTSQHVAVIDHGIGVPEQFQKIIFDKFVQVDTQPRRKKGGVGLGLAISRDIIERLGGKLWFTPNPEGGAIFHVEIATVE